jgi:hypothetical protein
MVAITSRFTRLMFAERNVSGAPPQNGVNIMQAIHEEGWTEGSRAL